MMPSSQSCPLATETRESRTTTSSGRNSTSASEARLLSQGEALVLNAKNIGITIRSTFRLADIFYHKNVYKLQILQKLSCLEIKYVVFL
jgi:hypothetical protein